jgi:hypothetical protein
MKRFAIWSAGCAALATILGISAALEPSNSLPQSIFADMTIGTLSLWEVASLTEVYVHNPW